MMPPVGHALTSYRALLSIPAVYRAVQRAVDAERYRRVLVEAHVRPRPGMRLLDLGCGPSDLLAHMPDVDYTGIDHDARHVAVARRRFGDRGTFAVGDVTDALRWPAGRYDLVLAAGLLHHLDDDAADRICRRAADVLDPGGRFVTADVCRGVSRHPFARVMEVADRGRHVRDRSGYERLLRPHFGALRVATYGDLLRVPNGYLIMEASAR